MLSFIMRIVNAFERNHGVTPTLLYLNRTQLRALTHELEDRPAHHELVQMLGIELVISDDVIHPHVAWTEPRHLGRMG